jgi:hypothetical protein
MKCPKVLTAVAATVVLSVATAMAQSYLDASSKARGDYSSSSVSRLLGSARGSAQDYRDYANGSKKVDPEIAKDASDAIGDYIGKSKKHLAWMRASAQHGEDKETLTSLDQIDKDMAAAENAHKEMHDLCSQKTVDAAESMKCCERIDDSLSKAIAEHDKLMKRLGLAMPAPIANGKSL